MYLNDLNSAKHNVEKLNRVLSQTFNHEVDLSEMSTDSLNRMLSTTEAKMMAIKENDFKYWENAQYNKLGLIQHQLKTYLNEIAPVRSDGKTMKAKTESVVMEDELEQAEVMLAAQELVDELQGMVEDIAEMQVQKLMPIVDAMKEQVGFEQAEAYNNAVDSALGGLLEQSKSAKDAVENATLAARGEAPAAPMPTDMGMDDEGDMDGAQDMDMDTDDFGGDEAESGEDNAIGRELKGESALADMEKGALAEKKFLESKDRLFKMVESGQMSQEHFINVINELNEDPTDAERVGLKDLVAQDRYIDKKKAGKPWWYKTPDEKDRFTNFKAKYKNDPITNYGIGADAIDGGIPQGTTKGGPSKLRQRQMAKQGGAGMRAMTTGEIAARDYGGDVKGGEFGGIMADPVKRVKMGKTARKASPDEIDYERELSSDFTGRKYPMDGGIAQGTTTGGPSKLRQRQMLKKQIAQQGGGISV